MLQLAYDAVSWRCFQMANLSFKHSLLNTGLGLAKKFF